MRIDELETKVQDTSSNDELLTLIKLKKVLHMIKTRETGGDSNATSVKKKILSRWKSGEKAFSKFKPDLDTLNISLHDVMKLK